MPSALTAGAANAWSVLSADPERDLVFVPTGSASPDFYGGERPGEALARAAPGDRADEVLAGGGEHDRAAEVLELPEAAEDLDALRGRLREIGARVEEQLLLPTAPRSRGPPLTAAGAW